MATLAALTERVRYIGERLDAINESLRPIGARTHRHDNELGIVKRDLEEVRMDISALRELIENESASTRQSNTRVIWALVSLSISVAAGAVTIALSMVHP